MRLAEVIYCQSRAVITVVAILCVTGIIAAWQLPSAIFPNTDFPRVVIIIDNGEVPAEQMLATVTRPVEEAMNGIPGIRTIKSRTSRGSAEINLFFDWGTNAREELQLVQAHLAQLQLPPTAAIQHIERLTFAVFPVLGYSVTSDTRDLSTLREIATYTIRPRLARLPGIAEVAVAGGSVREFHIVIDPEKLAARNITSQQVVDAVKNANVIESPGLIEENHQLELALVSGQATSADQLSSIVVSNSNGANILVSDIATVRQGTEPNYTIVNADGHDAVLVNIDRQPDANTLTVTDEVKSELAAIEKTLPKDVHIAPFYDQSLLIRDSMRSVRDAIVIGLILSVVILFAFLRNVGTTFVAILVIPVTILVTFLAMYLVGLSFDLMTLGGVAAAIGLVIDDAIVVVENIYTHLLHGESRLEAVHNAVSEITIPIIGSTITPVVVFLPLTILTGVTGVFFRSLALTMSVALLTSLVLALTFTPVLAEKFVRLKQRGSGEELGKVLSFVIRPYEWLLRFALENRIVVLVVCVLVLIASFVFFELLGSEFLPPFDEGAFVLDYKAPPGSALTETDRMLHKLEDQLRETPEVETYSRRTGLEMGFFITEPNEGDYMVKLKRDRTRTTDEVTDEIREKVESSQPALQVEFAGILTDLIGDLTSSPEPIEIKIFSDDKPALEAKAEEVEKAIQDIDGVVDTASGVIVSGPAVTYQIDPARAAQFSMSAADIAASVETAMTGTVASNVLEKGRVIAVRVTFPPETRGSMDKLSALQIRSPSGALFRLDQVATVSYDKGQTEIDREGLRQMVAVTARVTGSDLGTAISRIRQKLTADVKLPPGMTIEYGGLYAEQQASFRELSIALVLAVVLVFLVLLIEFRSFAYPLAIVTGAVLALSGVLAALLITHTTLNVVSLMGMIMVVGIVAKNGILMLDAVDENLHHTGDMKQALIISGRRRFRPVLMTSLAAVLGMAPLALAIGSGAELLQPLAVAVIGGLSFALILSLVVTPTVFAWLYRPKPERPHALME